MASTARVGIVVPTADPTKAPAAKCLDIVRRTTAHLDVDVRPIVSSGPDFRLARSINRGFRETADADAWVLLNDDALMDDGWLDALLDAARRFPQVGVWGAVLRFADGRMQHAGGAMPLTPREYLAVATRKRAPLWALRNLRAQRFRPYVYMWDHHPRLSTSNRLDFVTGACQLVTRACHEKIGGYSEDYLFGAEDVDYCLRAREAGFELGIASRCTGVHLEGASGQSLSPKMAASMATFRERWPPETIQRLTRRRRGVYA